MFIQLTVLESTAMSIKSGSKTETEKADPETERDTPENPVADEKSPPREYGGPKGLEPTRYGDWEKKGRCIDF